MAHDAVILDRRKVPSADRDRVGKLDLVVTYQVAQAKPKFLVFRKDTVTAAEVLAAIKAEEKGLPDVVGKTVAID